MDINIRDLGKHRIVEIVGDVDLYNVVELKQTVFKLLDTEDIQSLIVSI